MQDATHGTMESVKLALKTGSSMPMEFVFL